MRPRPLSLTILSCVFIAAGIGGLVVHSLDLRLHQPFHYDLILILSIRVLAIVFGVYLLQGSNWARCGTILWLALHVAISLHPWQRLVVHALLLAVFSYFLFTSPAREYFRTAKNAAP